jgi:hypothetical protein
VESVSEGERGRLRYWIFALLVAVTFLVWNREAYRGYFQTDEIDNVSWTPYVHAIDYLKVAASPRFQANNFRPVGHFFFREICRSHSLFPLS